MTKKKFAEGNCGSRDIYSSPSDPALIQEYTIPNRHMLELNQTYNPFKEEIFQDPLVVRKGYMDLHNKPGYGMELKPGIAEKFPYLPGRYDGPNPDLPLPG